MTSRWLTIISRIGQLALGLISGFASYQIVTNDDLESRLIAVLVVVLAAIVSAVTGSYFSAEIADRRLIEKTNEIIEKMNGRDGFV